MLTWYEQDKTTAVIKFFCDISSWGANADVFTQLFETLDAKFANILIRAHCYGGGVLEGNAIYNCLAARKCYLTIRNEGVCASMFTIIMLPADRIEVCENALFMIHSPSGGAYGTAKDMTSAAKILGLMEKNFTKAYSAKMKKPFDKAQYFDGSDHWLDAEEAISIGLADAIVPPVTTEMKEVNKPATGNETQALYTAYLAKLPETTVLPNATTKALTTDINMKQLLITMFALQGVDANSSDADVMNAIQAKFQAQQSQITKLENDMKALAKAQIDACLASAETVTGKPFEAAHRAQLEAIGQTMGVASLQAVLGITASTVVAPAASAHTQTPAPTPNIINLSAQQQHVSGPDDRKAWNFEMWQEKDQQGLERMVKENPAAYKALYKAEFGAEPEL